jgi:hypothetical protein
MKIVFDGFQSLNFYINQLFRIIFIIFELINLK